MPENSVSLDHSQRNLLADIITAFCFVLALGIASLWFEIRKGRNDFYPTDWLLLAPLDLEGGEEVTRKTDLLLADGGEASFTAKAGHTFKLPSGREVIWSPYTGSGGEVPFVILKSIVSNRITSVVGYAQTTVKASEDKEVQLGVAADDGIKIWVNGVVVFDRGPSDAYQLDKDTLLVSLKKGDNKVLVKNTQLDGGWGFALHFSDK